MPEKVVRGFISFNLMDQLKDDWLREKVDGVFWEDERLVVIPEEEYERLVKVEKAARVMDAQVAKTFGLRE